MIQVKSTTGSVQGARHTTNDDFAFLNLEQGIYILCDGVSEGGKGRIAAEFISKVLQSKIYEVNLLMKKNSELLQGPKRLQYMQEKMMSAFQEAQEQIEKAALIHSDFQRAATTCLALWLDGRFGILGHVGDSRAYLFRSGKVFKLTKDHSGKEQLLKLGMSESEASKHPIAHSITRAMGAGQQGFPDLLKIEFQEKDQFLLCTDGVYQALHQNDFIPFFNGLKKFDPKELLEKCAVASGDDSTMISIEFPESIFSGKSPISAEERIHHLQETPLLKHCDFAQKSHVAAICEIDELKAGSVLIQEETEGESMYVIVQGTLEVKLKGQHLTYKRKGEFLGEVAVVMKSKRTATVIAKEDCILLSLNRSALQEVFRQDVELEKNILRALLESTLDRMVEQGIELAHLKKV